MPRESKAKKRERAQRIAALLEQEYPEATCALEHHDPYELLVATILAAQCTDARVNMVTPGLFKRWPNPRSLAKATQAQLEEVVHSTGFYRNKAKNLIGMAKAAVERHAGTVPATMEELTALPGVARKTANVVLGTAYHQNVGVVVDTHVTRLSQRLALTAHEDPTKIERDLMECLPQDMWTDFAHAMGLHGRRICVARKPRCAACVLREHCPSRQDVPRPRPLLDRVNEAKRAKARAARSA